MKGLLLSILLFTLVLGVVVADTVLCARAVDALEESLARIPSDDIAKAASATEAFRTEWDRRFLLLVVSVPRVHTADVEEELSDLIGAIEAGEKGDVTIAIENMREVLSHMKRAILPSLSYIL